MFTLALMVICLSSLPVSGAQQNRHTVLIDPAHGGGDAGVFSDQLQEKDLTLNLALLIRQEAQKGAGLDIQLTRSADKTTLTSERIKAVIALQPACFLSLHVNAGFGKKATGYEVYFPGFRQTVSGGGDSAAILKDMEKNSYLNDSVRLAQHIQASLETVFFRKGRGLRDAPSPLLDALTIPGLVVEIGFATHMEDRKKLADKETQKAIARALVKGLQEYFKKMQ